MRDSTQLNSTRHSQTEKLSNVYARYEQLITCRRRHRHRHRRRHRHRHRHRQLGFCFRY